MLLDLNYNLKQSENEIEIEQLFVVESNCTIEIVFQHITCCDKYLILIGFDSPRVHQSAVLVK